MSAAHVVVFGASLGGVGALLEIAKLLPPDFPAIVGITLHVGTQPSILPELLSRRGPNPAIHPRADEPPKPGILYVAPPDHHMLLEPEGIRLSRGPRENHVRPAIDPLFRSAAIGWGPRAIGVVLTGDLDDGTAGLAAIKQCGGLAIVQDPREAAARGMPESALANVEVDHCLPLAEIVPLVARLVARPSVASNRTPPERLLREHAAAGRTSTMNEMSEIGQVSNLTCPECGGALWEIGDERPLRYRCHTGHAYTARSLDDAQAGSVDHALSDGLRRLREREMLLLRLASVSEGAGDRAQAEIGRREAARVRQQAAELEQMTKASTAANTPSGSA